MTEKLRVATTPLPIFSLPDEESATAYDTLPWEESTLLISTTASGPKNESGVFRIETL